MPITTKSELKDAISTWLARSDLDSYRDDIISLAEAKLNRLTELRITEIDTTLTGVIGDATLDLPADYLSPVSLRVLDTTLSTAYVDLLPQTVAQMALYSDNGRPLAWAVDGDEIRLDRPCDQAYSFTFRYVQSFELANDGDTNWLLTNAPDVYLAACMVEAYWLTKDTGNIQAWETRLRDAIDQVVTQAKKSKSRAQLTVDDGLLYVNRQNRRWGAYW